MYLAQLLQGAKVKFLNYTTRTYIHCLVLLCTFHIRKYFLYLIKYITGTYIYRYNAGCCKKDLLNPLLTLLPNGSLIMLTVKTEKMYYKTTSRHLLVTIQERIKPHVNLAKLGNNLTHCTSCKQLLLLYTHLDAHAIVTPLACTCSRIWGISG